MKVDEGIISIDIGNTNLGSTTAECVTHPRRRSQCPKECSSHTAAEASRPAARLGQLVDLACRADSVLKRRFARWHRRVCQCIR